ncbi:hypothetical protein LV779_19695 [Streptomyces thinghirensis]|nr:hypothetical protein [Streptomyces thinghirensis]
MAHPRLRRPRPLQGHPHHRRGHPGRHRPALQGGRRRLGGPHRSTTAASTTGTPPVEQPPTAASRDYAIVHYKREDGNYRTGACTPGATSPTARRPPGPTATPSPAATPTEPSPTSKLKPGASDVSFSSSTRTATRTWPPTAPSTSRGPAGCGSS